MTNNPKKTPIWNARDLKSESLSEAYQYFDQNIRTLPKTDTGEINEAGPGFVDNDVDAFRHAYVSGVFTQNYNVSGAKFFGFVQELFGNYGSQNNAAKAKNMDYWNNAVGRKYGQKTSSREELAEMLHEELDNGGMIIDFNDQRKYDGDMSFYIDPEKPVVVLNEKETGCNELFADLVSGNIMTR